MGEVQGSASLFSAKQMVEAFDEKWYPMLASTAIGEGNLGHDEQAARWGVLCREFRSLVQSVSRALESATPTVECPDCGFSFDASHTDFDGGYSCPNCFQEAMRSKVVWLRFWFRNSYELWRSHPSWRSSRWFAFQRGLRAAWSGARQGLWR